MEPSNLVYSQIEGDNYRLAVSFLSGNALRDVGLKGGRLAGPKAAASRRTPTFYLMILYHLVTLESSEKFPARR